MILHKNPTIQFYIPPKLSIKFINSPSSFLSRNISIKVLVGILIYPFFPLIKISIGSIYSSSYMISETIFILVASTAFTWIEVESPESVTVE